MSLPFAALDRISLQKSVGEIGKKVTADKINAVRSNSIIPLSHVGLV